MQGNPQADYAGVDYATAAVFQADPVETLRKPEDSRRRRLVSCGQEEPMKPSGQLLKTVIVTTMISLTAAACSPANPAGPSAAQAKPAGGTPADPAAPPIQPAQLIAVSGVVFEVGPAGRVPIKNAYVEACGYASAETDANGLFTIEVPADTPSLFVQAVGFAGASASVSARMEVRLVRE